MNPLIFVIGASGAGKTALARAFVAEFPQWTIHDDVDIVYGLLADSKWSRDGHLLPAAWDHAARRLGASLPPGPVLVVLARGHDPAYLQWAGISEQDVYPRALALVLEGDAERHAAAGAVLVTAHAPERLRRVAARTHQPIPAEVMQDVFLRDCAPRALPFPLVLLDNGPERVNVAGFLAHEARRVKEALAPKLPSLAPRIPTIDLPVDLSALQAKVLLSAARGDAPDKDAEMDLSTLLHAALHGLRDPDPERRRSWALVLRRVGEVLGEAGGLLDLVWRGGV